MAAAAVQESMEGYWVRIVGADHLVEVFESEQAVAAPESQIVGLENPLQKREAAPPKNHREGLPGTVADLAASSVAGTAHLNTELGYDPEVGRMLRAEEKSRPAVERVRAVGTGQMVNEKRKAAAAAAAAAVGEEGIGMPLLAGDMSRGDKECF
jgi:hypothetical protein